jgi:hypothetical protein
MHTADVIYGNSLSHSLNRRDIRQTFCPAPWRPGWEGRKTFCRGLKRHPWSFMGNEPVPYSCWSEAVLGLSQTRQ